MPLIDPRRAATLAVVLTAVVAAACAPDDLTRAGPARPARAAADTADSAAADTIAAPLDTAALRRADVDSLLGDAAPAVRALLNAHRAAAGRAIDSLTAASVAAIDLPPEDEEGEGEAAPDDSLPEDGGNGDRWSARRVARRAARYGARPSARRVARAADADAPAPRVTTRETVSAGGGRSFVVEATTRVAASADPVAGGSLTLTRDETVTIVPARGAGAGVREDLTVRIALPYCPDPAGRVEATVFATARAWRRYAMSAADAPPDGARWDRRRESALDGTVTTQVGDDAEVAWHDVDLLSRVTLDADASTRVEGSARFAASRVPPSRLGDPLASRPAVDPTGDYGALAQLGVDERLLYPYARAELSRQLAAARAQWRGGRCVDVTLREGVGARVVDVEQVVSVAPVPTSRVDGSTPFPATLRARADGATISPLAKLEYAFPMVYTFTMPEQEVRVEMRAASRRGIGTRTVLYRPNALQDGWLEYSSTSSYAVAAKGPSGAATASAAGRQRVRSDLKFVFDERTAGGELIFKVYARNAIEVSGSAKADGQGPDGSTGAFAMSIGGSGTTSNPRAASDPVMNPTFTVTAQGQEGGGLAGELRLQPVGDPTRRRFFYSLQLYVGQIAADYAWTYSGYTPCRPKGSWRVELSFSNQTRRHTTDVTDPLGCQRFFADGSFEHGPFTFGFLSMDRTDPAPGGRGGSLIYGYAYYNGTGDVIEGEESRQNTDCEEVRFLDPLDIATLGRPGVAIPGWNGGWTEGGSCRFQYTMKWFIPWPEAVSAPTVGGGMLRRGR